MAYISLLVHILFHRLIFPYSYLIGGTIPTSLLVLVENVFTPFMIYRIGHFDHKCLHPLHTKLMRRKYKLMGFLLEEVGTHIVHVWVAIWRPYTVGHAWLRHYYVTTPVGGAVTLTFPSPEER